MLHAAILACLLLPPAPTLDVPFDLQPSAAVELRRFPGIDESKRLWQRSRAYRDWQRDKRRMGWTMANAYAEVIAEAEAGERAWDVLTNAQYAATWNERLAREHLARLRAILGEDAYAAGWMPHPSPGWLDTEGPPR